MGDTPTIAVVGPCAAGKSTLIRQLRTAGYQARHIAQEHSFVPYMWQRLSQPDILIFLDVSFPVSMTRRPDSRWNEREYQEQQHRLRHARQHADLYIQTDNLSPEQVFALVLRFLEG
ncbi:MAG: hypothetical protein D6755_07115 [Anaerolineae bacterium]|nr:MAG: hypothetical protein D6755_07115 [Anaerolineae bacterium]